MVLQAAIVDGLSFDPFPFDEDGVAASEVDVGGSEVVEALVIAPMVVAIDEGRDLAFEIARQEVVLSRMRFLSVWCQRSILPWV